jgi:TRAP-type C4-dicarboxylate transport system permease small subunit
MSNIGLRTIDSFIKGYAHFTQGLRKACEFGLIIMTLTITYHVIMRYIFKLPTFWAIEINGYLLVFISLIGLAEVSRAKRMIRIDLFLKKMSPMTQVRIKLFYLPIMLFFCIITSWKGFQMVACAYQRGLCREGILHTPLFIPYLIPPISLGIMALQVLIEIRENVKRVVHHKNSEGVSL